MIFVPKHSEIFPQSKHYFILCCALSELMSVSVFVPSPYLARYEFDLHRFGPSPLLTLYTYIYIYINLLSLCCVSKFLLLISPLSENIYSP
jgi:hypothetical protein